MAALRGDDSEGLTGPSGGDSSSGRHVGHTLALSLIFAAFWILLSGRINVQNFIFLGVSVAIVLWLNPERPFRPIDISRGQGISGRLRATVALGRYLVWLVWNVLKANVEVAIMILHPRLPIRPRLLRFRTTLEHDVARVLVANSITLTPGTVTIDLVEDEYLVHAIHPDSTKVILDAELQNVVAPIFGEGADPVPEVRWASSLHTIRAKAPLPAERAAAERAGRRGGGRGRDEPGGGGPAGPGEGAPGGPGEGGPERPGEGRPERPGEGGPERPEGGGGAGG